MSAAPARVSFVDIGRRINSICIEYGAVEEAQRAMPEASEQYGIALDRLVTLLDEQTALQDLALVMQANTLTDAAVQLAIVFDTLAEVCFSTPCGRLQSGDPASALAKLQRAWAAITLVVADAAGLKLDQVGEPNLMTRLTHHCQALAACT
jgi:hypothetical protein